MSRTLVHPTQRKLPYFALGSKFDEPVSVERAFSNFRWTVEPKPIAWIGDPVFEGAPDGLRTVHRYEKGSMLVRSDTNEAFGPVGDRYEIINNSDIEEMLDGGGYQVEAIGSTDEGRRCWAVLNAGPYSDFQVNGDPWNAFFITRWNHDGSGAVKFGLQFWRRICTNGMRGVAGTKWQSIRHTSSAPMHLELARELIPQFGDVVESFVARSIQYSKTTELVGSLPAILDQLWPKPRAKKDPGADRRAQEAWAMQRIMFNDVRFSETNYDFRHTDYGIINAVNEVEQWSKSRNTGTSKLARSQLLRLDSDRFPLTERVLEFAA